MKKGNLVTPIKDMPLFNLFKGIEYPIQEIHEGNIHTPELMITVGNYILYAWRFTLLD